MTIYSFVREHDQLLPVEVELTLLPGIPQMRVLGLPDSALRESAFRLKSALRHQGFRWPKAQQILVNLKPSHIKKSSAGLDLAIAVALLVRMGQWRPPSAEPLYAYGEVGLEGHVSAPSDIERLRACLPSEAKLWTGTMPSCQGMNLLMVNSLNELSRPVATSEKTSDIRQFERPLLPQLRFGEEAALWMTVAALGGHSVMLAGPAGSGKTTWAEGLYKVLPDMHESEWREILQWSPEHIRWRPLVIPHHTSTTLSLLGGGVPPRPGEITRAHRGLLLLDEYLEFAPRVQEALREPCEKGEIRISRRGDVRVFPAQFQLVATTNLCSCGRLSPGQSFRCPKSLVRCRSYLERLSGPMLDRFDMLLFSNDWQQRSRTVVLETILETVVARSKPDSPRRMNGQLSLEELESMVDRFTLRHLMPTEVASLRRRRAILRVARTFADLDGSEMIDAQHIERASEPTLKAFTDLSQIHA